MKYRTCSDVNLGRYCSSGCRTRPIFTRTIKDGVPALVQTGIEDIQEAIELAAEGADVQSLLARSRAGDPRALGVAVDSYADLVGAPKNLLEAQVQMVKAEQTFAGLPVDVRQAYSNNLSKFLAAVADGSFTKDRATKRDGEAKAAADAAFVAASSPPLSQEAIDYIKSKIGG